MLVILFKAEGVKQYYMQVLSMSYEKSEMFSDFH